MGDLKSGHRPGLSAGDAAPVSSACDGQSEAELRRRLSLVRERTLALAKSLSDADASAQSMADASPAKWHLAHTSWFFEEFILVEHVRTYERFDDRYAFLFNSYYEAKGARHPRPARGLLTRPSLDEVRDYRRHVDAALSALDGETLTAAADLIELGIHHEQQHQELFFTDLLHLFAQNPLEPAYGPYRYPIEVVTGILPSAWYKVVTETEQVEIGAGAEGFAFDCERPLHIRLVHPFAMMSRPVTNAEWFDFIADGGYQTASLWLSDGWAAVNTHGWRAPLYWEWREEDGLFWHHTLGGTIPVNAKAPVAHISYFEADAYARWAGYRLPREDEWELFATRFGSGEPTADDPCPVPRPLAASTAPQAVLGGVWEWTQSAYTEYPGFRPLEGAPGEYNGKFMSGQFVLRGGSCATPSGHVRTSYRNFFYPHQRWQFSGLRLARDL